MLLEKRFRIAFSFSARPEDFLLALLELKQDRLRHARVILRRVDLSGLQGDRLADY
jgi:hypothetical protein